MARQFPDWLKAFCNYAGYSEAPSKLLFWTGVSTIAGALRRRVWIDQKYFTWTPNFYTVLVAKPGVVTKSTTINVGMNLLRKLPSIDFGPDVITWQALVQSMEKAQKLVPIPGTGDFMPMACVTVSCDEFGTFLDPDDRKMIDVMVSLWDGKRGTFQKVTKNSGNDIIENPWINVIGCTTPAWITQNFPQYMIGGGFTSRCIFLFATEKRQLVPYPGLVVPLSHSAEEKALVDDLEHISNFFGEYTLSKAATVWGSKWYDEHWNNNQSPLKGTEYEGYLARKQTHIHKVAMIIAAAQRDVLIIEESDLAAAEQVLAQVETELPAVFKRIGLTEVPAMVQELAEQLSRGPIHRQDLYKRLVERYNLTSITSALQALQASGQLDQVNPTDPNPLYRIKP